MGLIPGSGRALEKGMATHSSCSCLENPTGRGAWRATIHGVAKNQTQLSELKKKQSERQSREGPHKAMGRLPPPPQCGNQPKNPGGAERRKDVRKMWS